MKQIIQSFKTGQTILEEVPAPVVSKGSLLIRTTHSLVSLGTERMLVEFGKANLIQKARQQPDKVKMVLDKIKAEGLIPTLETVFNKLEQPLPLGYCNVGVVEAVGDGVSGFSVGDRVASNGPHAEYVLVPQNLVAKIPTNVSQEEAAFTVIASIGLQGIRLVNPTFGETVVVIGLGLIGLLTAQMLLANGCKVIGIDLDQSKCDLAQSWGVISINPSQGVDTVKVVMQETDFIGADAVIITASAKTNSIISEAAQMSRKRGRIVLVGVVGLDISRAEFFEKELTFQVSCSYGPGRYDENYEQKGIDYPLPFVRWTEKRNFQAILQSISSGQIQVKPLISEIVALEDFQSVYGTISASKSIASILKYPDVGVENSYSNTLKLKPIEFTGKKGTIGIIGAGNFTKMTMLPALKGSGANFKYIASSGGLSGTELGKKFGFAFSTTDYKSILQDPDVDAVLITTRHNSHAKFVQEVLEANKHAFVEKPLAINWEQFHRLETFLEEKSNNVPSIMVGFNRRFSPHIQAIKKSMGNSPQVNIVATMNAGFIPSNVWVHDMAVGGGRIIGEACHYLDLCVYLTGSLITEVCMSSMGQNPEENTDNASIIAKFANGSQAVINYFSNGSKAYSKERIEVYSNEKTWIMDNFRKTSAYGVKGFSNLSTKLDKGHKEQFHRYIKFLKEGGAPLISLNEILNVSKASLAAIDSLKVGNWVKIR
ncbi:bi-domain-containing oxidoreductase [Mongoliitalea lutea]|uniref:Oxidoreductase n=1 Tax=Mongoliitalea lutea TaxID=849756 RepID=A0A8J3CVG2_9BACT|nr:bi-domain-containing oxidoreductase [Mongoliitalea lutea]GHB31350.1 oxidoreductase [Mongoliitalea lutea]